MQKNKSKAYSKRKSIFRAIMSLSLAATLCFHCSLTLAQEASKIESFLTDVMWAIGSAECNSAEEVICKLKSMSTYCLYDTVYTSAILVYVENPGDPYGCVEQIINGFIHDVYSHNYYLVYLIDRILKK